MTGKVLNALGYQVVWIASVLGAARGLAWAGPLAAAAFACAVLATSTNPRDDARLLPLAFAFGALADSAWIALGWIDYGAAWPSDSFAPAWILGLWVSLALTLNHSFAFLRERLALAALLGAIGGPAAYWTASRWGAVRFEATDAVVLGGLALAWALLFPALAFAAGRRSHTVATATRTVP